MLELLDKKDTYIVGVSGGCDSMCLLDILYENGYNIIVCHVDYGIRNDTMIDYQIVHDYCESRNIIIHDLKVQHYDKGNFEQQARIIRYQFFYDVGNLYHTNKVIVAHHKDDLYETILMQQERDYSYIKLGMDYISHIYGLEVYRVLLDMTKKEIIDYCNRHNVLYHDDYTNADTSYKRNYYRHHIVKHMSEKDKEDLLCFMHEHNKELEARKSKYLYIMKDVMNVKELDLNDLDDFLYFYLERYIPVYRISRGLVDELKKVIFHKGNSKIMLPVNKVFIKEYDNIFITENKEGITYSYTFDSFEEFECEYFKLTSNGHPYDGIGLTKDDFPITIRSFRNGDRIKIKTGTKKVNRIFIDKKIPDSLRKTWPIVVNKEGTIVLIPHIIKNFDYFNVKVNVFVVKC